MKSKNMTKSRQRKRTFLIAFALFLGIILCVELAIVIYIQNRNQFASSLQTDQTNPAPEESGYPVVPTEQYQMKTFPLSTKYCTIALPEEGKELLKHQEVVQGTIAVEIFSMLHDKTETELFRVYFGDANIGTFIGFLATESGDVPVSYDVCSYEQEFFQNEKTKELYYQMMDSFTVILDSIYSNSSFQEDDYTVPTEEQRVSMKYWNVDVLEEIEWEEVEQKDLYRADFYAELHGERTLLYSISLGETETGDYTIGYFSVDGKYRPVWINVYALNITEAWEEEEITTGYRMLETLNAVTDVIIASSNYAEDIQ